MAKSILILSTTAGSGHVRAGDALVETAKTLSLPLTLRHEDILEFTFPLFKKLYAEVHNTIVKTSPDLWGYLYKKTEGRKSTGQGKAPLIKLFDQFNYKKFLRALGSMKPDAVVCTHFLPYAAISDELRKPTWCIPFYSIPTDYYAHSLWLNESIERYYVATDEVAWTIQASGIPEDRTMVTGIPVVPQFGKRTNKRVARSEFGLALTDFTVMILSGGYGIGVIDELVLSVAKFLSSYERKRFQLIVVCERNRKLFDKLSRAKPPVNVSMRIFQFVPFVDKLMDCANVLITKSGGLSVSEALAKHLPMIVYDPFPGQEALNAEYLVENGAAVAVSSFASLHYKLKQLIDHPERLKRMKTSAGKIARPNAAQRILEDVVKHLQ